jgi:hypothetical protein
MQEDIPNDNEQTAVAGETGTEPITNVDLSTSTGNGERALQISSFHALILSVGVACLIWGILQIILPVFQLPEHLRDLEGNISTEQSQEIMDVSLATSNRNAAFSLALWASTLGLFVTVAEVKYRRPRLRAIWGGLLAILVSGGFAVGGAALGGILSEASALPEDPLTRTIIVQATMLGLVGLGIGLGLGLAVTLPMFRPRLSATCIAAGILGGLLAGLIFPIASSVVLPNARTEVLLPDPGISRFLWLALASSGIVLTLTLTNMGKQGKAGT